MNNREFTVIDNIISQLDLGLRTLFGSPQKTDRPNPAADITHPKSEPLDQQQKILSGRLMRINHCGEVAAQGLYQGQALTARLTDVREKMQQAATEENDHLDWCANRINELNSHTSLLNPVWYLGSFTIGAVAGLIGDKWSLGFVAETERQVVQHLESHLEKIAVNDKKSRAILQQMKRDEGEHATLAIEAGGVELPDSVKIMMKFTSKIMTRSSYWL